MACGRCHTDIRGCSSGFITTFIRFIQNKSLESNSGERRAPRAHSEHIQTHNPINQNSSTQTAIQSPPQAQVLDFQPFLMKAGYKQAAPDSLWRLNSANIALPLPVLLHPHQPFLCHQPSSPWVNPHFSTINTTPRFLGTSTQSKCCWTALSKYWKSLHPPAHSLTHSHFSLKESKAKQQPYFKKKLLPAAPLLQQEESIRRHQLSAKNMRSWQNKSYSAWF